MVCCCVFLGKTLNLSGPQFGQQETGVLVWNTETRGLRAGPSPSWPSLHHLPQEGPGWGSPATASPPPPEESHGDGASAPPPQLVAWDCGLWLSSELRPHPGRQTPDTWRCVAGFVTWGPSESTALPLGSRGEGRPCPEPLYAAPPVVAGRTKYACAVHGRSGGGRLSCGRVPRPIGGKCCCLWPSPCGRGGCVAQGGRSPSPGLQLGVRGGAHLTPARA